MVTHPLFGKVSYFDLFSIKTSRYTVEDTFEEKQILLTENIEFWLIFLGTPMIHILSDTGKTSERHLKPF